MNKEQFIACGSRFIGRTWAGGIGLVCLLLLAAVWVLPANAQEGEAPDLGSSGDFNKGGRTTFQFLKIGVGARQAALGSASIAVVQDVNAAFWNPAGIVGIERFEAAFSYTRWFADMSYTGGAIGGTWRDVGTLALSVAALDSGAIQEAVVGGGGANDTRTGNTVSGGDLMAGLSLSRRFTDRLAIGVTAKVLRESLWEYNVTTYAFDVGTFYDMGYNGLTLAMSLQNFGGSVSFLDDEQTDRQEGYDLPLVFRIGAAARLIGVQEAFIDMGPAHHVVLSAEAINTNDFSERLHLGLEYALSGLLVLRGGYRLGYEEGRWAAGFGLAPEVGSVQLRIDYAYGSNQYLQDPHRLTMSLAF